MARNTALYEAMRRYALKVLQHAASPPSLGPCGMRWKRVVDNGNGYPGFRQEVGVFPDDKLQTSDEYRACMDELKKDSAIWRHCEDCEEPFYRGEPFGMGRAEPDKIIHFVVKKLIDENSKAFDQGIFDCAYNNMESFFEADSVVLESLTPLHGISDSCNISLNFDTDEITIGRMSDDEIVSLLESAYFPLAKGSERHITDDTIARYAIRIRRKTPKWDKSFEFPVHCDTIFSKVMQALHIAKKGYFCPCGTAYRALIPYPSLSRAVNYNHYLAYLNNVALSQVDADELEPTFELMRFCPKMKNRKNDADELKRTAEDSKFPDYAIKVFSRAVTEPDVEDRIVDLMTCAEALFLPTQSSELSYRMRIRAAYFCGSNADERLEICDDFKKMYDLRSAIVHGNNDRKKNLKKKVEDSLGRAQRIEDYLRGALSKSLQLVGSDNKLSQPKKLSTPKGWDKYLDGMVLSAPIEKQVLSSPLTLLRRAVLWLLCRLTLRK